MDLSGQSVNTTSNTSVSTPTSSDLSKPRSALFLSSSLVIGSTSIPNSTSVVTSTATPSMSTQSTAVSQTTVSFNTDTGSVVPSPSANMTSTSLSLLSDSSSPSATTPTPPTPPTSDTVTFPSSTDLTLGNTASPTTGTSVRQSSEGPASSTVVSVTVVAASPSVVETSITTRPASTLPKPVFSTSTDSNGLTHILTPPLVTIMSTSTESNGSLITTTLVVANPQQEQQQVSAGVLSNPQAVAGIFTVVGLGFAGFVVFIVFCIRRQRRMQRNKWIDQMRPQDPSDDPFRDDDNAPPVDTTTEDSHWHQKGIFIPTTARASSHNFVQTNASVPPNMYSLVHDSDFNKPENHQPQFQDAAPSSDPNRVRYRPSWTPTTPSIYPVSLVPQEEVQISNDSVPTQIATTSNLPPRPPRSHLRDRVKSFGVKSIDYTPPTPPESQSSDQTSPTSETRTRAHDVLNRKTILDVRPRPSTS